MPKFQNIVGTGFPDFVQDQINTRGSIISSELRTGPILSYLNNRTGWFRMSSGAIINNSDEIAKNNILQGGIVSRNDNNTINLKKDFLERYTKGNDDDLGLRPMPGITGLNIGTQGRWQTLQEAEVEFTCYNLDQLNIMSQLYMSLGINVFIEFGHLPYYDNSKNIINKVDTINFFNTSKFSTSPSGRDNLIKEITNKEISTNGNYGALLGMVSNFSYTANPDGSYSCSSKVIGPGHLAEALTVNNTSGFFLFNERDDDQTTSEENRSDIEHVMHRLIKFASTRTNYGSGGTGGAAYSGKLHKKVGYGVGDLGNSFSQDEGAGGNGYDILLNEIYSNSNICESNVSFNKDTFVINDFNLAFGNATQIVNGLGENQDDLEELSKSNPHFFDLIQLDTDITDSERTYTYITLGHLFFLINNFSLLTSEKNQDKATPLKLDFHPDNTIIKSGVIQATVNPFVCVVPLKVGNKEKWSKFFGGVVVNKVAGTSPNDSFLEKIKLAIHLKTGGVFGTKLNYQKNLSNDPKQDRLSSLIDYIPLNDDKGNIKIFNVLVNLEMVLEVFENLYNAREDKKIFLLPTINKILDKISAALGGVNSLRTVVDEKNHIIRVVDEHNINNFDNGVVTIPTFGKDSIAYNYNYTSNISPKLASTIVIAAQAINNEGENIDGGLKSIADEILTYNYINGGVVDRFNVNINNPLTWNDDVDNVDKWNGKYQKLFDHLTNIYTLGLDGFETSVALDFTKTYIDRQQIAKNFDPSKSSTILIPLSLTLRMDGISGIRPYSAFKIPDERLPVRYRGKIMFIVYSINHVFENNKWFTELVGNTIYATREETPEDDRAYNELDQKQIPVITSEDVDNELVNSSYTQLPDSYTTASPKPEGKATPTPEDEQESSIINPPSDGSQNNQVIPLDDSSTKGAPTFGTSTSGGDIIGATELIKNNEVPGGRPILTAYKDKDYTTSSGYTYRIGFGSDTITSPDGSVRRVQKGDTITQSMAIADLNRRITQEFKPKVVQACQNNGVFYPSLPDCVKSVFIDCAYNYGTLWNSIVIAYRDGDKQGLINELKRRAEQGPSQVPSRRYVEINYLQTRC